MGRLASLRNNASISLFGYTHRHINLFKVFRERTRYFITRKVKPIKVPEGWWIESSQELLSYWDLFIEASIQGPWLYNLKTVVDIGANYGLFCRLVWQYNPTCNIIAYEPQAKLAQKLKKWENNNFEVRQLAVSNVKDKQELNLSHEGESASLNLWQGGATETVEVTTLDNELNTYIDLLKIDVDGGELNVLKGGVKLLEKVKYIIIEIVDNGTIEFLNKLGFTGVRLSLLDWYFTRK
jgi:FkbM family methyltransferase